MVRAGTVFIERESLRLEPPERQPHIIEIAACVLHMAVQVRAMRRH
jgi:hypothetical protein